ncbi:MAG: ATP-binding protein [Methanobacteriota archaeon]
MKPLSRIQDILIGLPPGTLSEQVTTNLERELTRAKAEYDHLKTKYNKSIQEKAVVHSLLQRSSEELIQRYRALFEYSGVPMVILNGEGLITLANSHFIDFTGIEPDDILNGIKFFDLIRDTDKILAEEYHQARRRLELVPTQYEVRLKIRSSFQDISLSIGLLPGGTDSLVSLHDVTEIKKQRAELTAHNERLEALLTLYQMTGEPESIVTAYAIQKGTALTMSKLGFISSIDEDGAVVSIEAFWSADTEGENMAPPLKRITVPINELPYIRQVLATGEPLILYTNPHAERVLKNILEQPIPFQRAMLIPIIEQEKVVLVACVAEKSENYDLSDQLQLTVLMSGMWRLIIRNRQEEALKNANKKLSLLSTLTRHDVLNLLTALGGYLELSEELTDNPEIISYIKKEIAAVHSIEEIIAFTRDYELVGIRAPSWQEINQVFSYATQSSLLIGIEVCSHTGGVWVYADPLLIRVFSNFIDNSLRHGGHVSRISLSWETSGEQLILIYQDDGDGVSWSEKEKIFIRGYGKHTGLGLFLIREIFSITGIGIRETGEPGRGVRFEMNIPRGNFRLLGDAGVPLGEKEMKTEDR